MIGFICQFAYFTVGFLAALVCAVYMLGWCENNTPMHRSGLDEGDYVATAGASLLVVFIWPLVIMGILIIKAAQVIQARLPSREEMR